MKKRNGRWTMGGFALVLGLLAFVPGLPAALADGEVWAWGDNSSGQLGDGTTTPRHLPVKASGLSGIPAIAAGNSHSAAIKGDGTAWAWGDNAQGELGNGSGGSKQKATTAVQTSGLSGVKAIAAGGGEGPLDFTAGGFTLGLLKSDGSVWAWGYNKFGQLGEDPTKTLNEYTPVQVSGLSGVKAIGAAGTFAAAVMGDGSVRAWGENGNGQLGDGTTTEQHTPVQVSGLSDVKAVAPGGYVTQGDPANGGFTLALKNDKTVWAWGSNGVGQLGDGTIVERHAPVQVKGLSGIKAIAAGWYHAVALANDGTVWAWGWNNFGQLGDGTTTDRHTPVHLSGISGVYAIAAGAYHTVALKNDGTVWTWGWNSDGQLGNGSTTDRATPGQVLGLPGVRAIAAGFVHTLAVAGAIQSLPDLQGILCTAPTNANWGDTVSVHGQIQNAGNAAAGVFPVQWYLSQNTSGSTADDVLLSQTGGKGTSYSHAGLAAGARDLAPFQVTLQLPLLADLPSGWSGTNFFIKMAVNGNFASLGKGLDWAPITIQAPLSEVTHPTALDVLIPGKAYPITWTDFTASTVKIDLYKGGTLNKPITASTLASKGSFTWTVAGNQPLGSDYAVKVSSTNPTASAYSGTFVVANPKVTYPTLAGVAWVGGKTYTITWSGFPPDASLSVDLYEGSVLRRHIATPKAGSLSYPWLVPGDVVTAGDYQVKVSSPANVNLVAASGQPFTIAQPQVTAPAANDVWLGGQAKSVTWSGFPVGANVRVDLYKNNVLNRTIAPAATNNGSLLWPVPATQAAGNDYTVKVTSAANATINAQSASSFTIALPLVTYPPAANAVLLAGKAATITWKGFPGKTVDINLVEGLNAPQSIKAGAANSGSFVWTVPAGQTPATDYQVKVSTTAGPSLSALGKVFTIPARKVTKPTGAVLSFQVGKPVAIAWSGFPGPVKIELDKSGVWAFTLAPSAATSAAGTGSFSGIIPKLALPGSDWTIKVTWTVNANSNASSDNPFAITP